MKHEDYVSFEQAVKLKELGYDWKSETFWDDEGSPQNHKWVIKHFHDYPFVTNDEDCTIFRPTLAQAQKWLREFKGIYVYAHKILSENDSSWYVHVRDLSDFSLLSADHNCKTYELALSAGIDKALELLKQENK